MNDLENYFYKNTGRLIHKWAHYFEVYDRHFQKYRNKEINILEIGVSQGGSLQMWKNYFGENAHIYGVDINPNCKSLEEKNIKIFIGSQSDRTFLRKIKAEIPPLDILIDDGGHSMIQQIVTYEELFNHIKEDGVYLCEDIHSSYWLRQGGGHKRRGTYIEYSKNFIDMLNAHHSEQKSLIVNEFTNTINSIHYYDSIVVIEKRKREKPYHIKTGNVSFETTPESKNIISILYNAFIKYLNKFLRFFRMPGFIWR